MSSQLAPVRRPRRLSFRTATAAVAAALVALGALTVASPAAAHDELLGTSPKADTAVAELPADLVLTFNGVLMDEPGATEVVVTDASGTDLTDGPAVLSGTRLTQPLNTQAAQPGPVTVRWRVVSSDGHPISNEFSFTYGDGSAVPTATLTAQPDPSSTNGDSAWGWPVAVVAIVLVGAGGAVVAVLLARSRGRRED